MKILGLVIILITEVTVNSNESHVEYEKSLLLQIINDVLNIAYGNPVFEILTCEEVNPNLIRYLLYTPDNKDDPVLLTEGEVNNNWTLFNTSLETKFLIHGWVTRPSSSWPVMAKDAYLERGNYNVVIVDWYEYAFNTYAKSACYLKSVAKVTADLLMQMTQSTGLQFTNTHIIGHSMGAQMAGIIGQNIQYYTNGEKLRRVTALDAAGPMFCHPILLEDDERVTPDDAYFIEGIHTNDGVVGCEEPYGHVDFYPNCGIEQPGCTNEVLEDVLSDDSLLNLLQRTFCSHQRAVSYWIESINSTGFVSSECDSCLHFNSKECENNKKEIMGEDTPICTTGRYYLNTNPSSQFAIN